jgi:hypothetical protein
MIKSEVYPTTQLLHGVVRVCIKLNEMKKLIMKIVSQLHPPTALPQELIGEEALTIRMDRTPPQN